MPMAMIFLTTLQMQDLLLVREEPHLPAQCQRLGSNGGQCRSADSPAQPPHKGDDQHNVAGHRKQRRIHGMARLSGGTQDSIHAKVHVRHHITRQDDDHELTGVWQRHIRSAEEAKDGIQKQQADSHKQKANDEVQRYRIT